MGRASVGSSAAWSHSSSTTGRTMTRPRASARLPRRAGGSATRGAGAALEAAIDPVGDPPLERTEAGVQRQFGSIEVSPSRKSSGALGRLRMSRLPSRTRPRAAGRARSDRRRTHRGPGRARRGRRRMRSRTPGAARRRSRRAPPASARRSSRPSRRARSGRRAGAAGGRALPRPTEPPARGPRTSRAPTRRALFRPGLGRRPISSASPTLRALAPCRAPRDRRRRGCRASARRPTASRRVARARSR